MEPTGADVEDCATIKREIATRAFKVHSHEGRRARETEAIGDHVAQRAYLIAEALRFWKASFGEPQVGEASCSEGRFFPELVFDLCMLDVFVEGAQQRMRQRAILNEWAGRGALVGLIAVVAAAAFYLYNRDRVFPSRLLMYDNQWVWLIHEMQKNVGILGLTFATIYMLSMLLRAYFHEATVLHNRRHSLRLGRLYLYLRLSSAKTPTELREAKRHLTTTEIETIFGWNRETGTAFKDIRGQTQPRDFWERIADGFEKWAAR